MTTECVAHVARVINSGPNNLLRYSVVPRRWGLCVDVRGCEGIQWSERGCEGMSGDAMGCKGMGASMGGVGGNFEWM